MEFWKDGALIRALGNKLQGALAALCLLAAPAVALEPFSPQILGPHGCTIGLESVAILSAQGWDSTEILAFAQAATASGQGSQQGRWVVLGPELCRIELPFIPEGPSVQDMVRAGLVSPPGFFSSYGFEGCYIWDYEYVLQAVGGLTAFSQRSAYDRLIAQGLKAGDLAYFSTDPDRRPPGFLVWSSDCPAALSAQMVRDNQNQREERFDRFVRALFTRTDCEEGLPAEETLAGLIPLNGQNRWIHREWLALVAASGWQEVSTQTGAATPRPPLCHYDAPAHWP